MSRRVFTVDNVADLLDMSTAKLWESMSKKKDQWRKSKSIDDLALATKLLEKIDPRYAELPHRDTKKFLLVRTIHNWLGFDVGKTKKGDKVKDLELELFSESPLKR